MAVPLQSAPQGPTASYAPTFYATSSSPTISSSAATSTTTGGLSAQADEVSSSVILRVGLSFIGIVAFIVFLGFSAKTYRARTRARREGRPVPSLSDIFFSSFENQPSSVAWLTGGGARNFTEADLLMYLERMREERVRREEEAKVPPRLWEFVLEEEGGKTGLEREDWVDEKVAVDEGGARTEGRNLPLMLCALTTNPPELPATKATDTLPNMSTLSQTIATFLISFPDPDDPPRGCDSGVSGGGGGGALEGAATTHGSEREREIMVEERALARRAAWEEREDLPPICFGLLESHIDRPPRARSPSGEDQPGAGAVEAGRAANRDRKNLSNEEYKNVLWTRHLERTGHSGGWTGPRGYHG